MRCTVRTRLLTTMASLSAAVLAASGALHAQAFKVQKFDIKGDGGTDYVAVEAATGRVFVSRSTHMMVVEGATGKVLGDIPNTPGVHGAGIATKAGHGFTTNSGDQTVTMFDLKTLAVIKQIKVGPGLDGIMYDEPDDKIILTNHSRPIGTLDRHRSQDRRHRRDRRARGHRARRRRRRRQGPHLRQQRRQEHDSGDRREDVEGDRVVAARAVRRADRASPTTRRSNRIFSGCSKTSVVVDASTGKVVATIPNGTRVDALGWDPAKKLIYIPNGGEGNVTVVHQDSADKYTVVATVADVRRREDHRGRSDDAQRVSVPARARSRSARRPPARRRRAAGRGRGPQGPIVAAWFIVITS